MKNLILKSTMLLGTAALLVVGAQAQNTKVSIPFAFEANGKSMPAGDYVLNRLDHPGLYAMKSATTHNSVLLTDKSVIGDAKGQVKLVFDAAPDAYYLTEVWDGQLGRRMASPHFKGGLLAGAKSATRVEIPGK